MQIVPSAGDAADRKGAGVGSLLHLVAGRDWNRDCFGSVTLDPVARR
jgi:hypothetical protein